MKKVFSIILVLVALLIVCTACDPTVGDDGGDEDRRVIELTFEIESLEAQVNEADNSSDLSALKDWAESCQIKIDTLRIEGESEVLDALEKRIEVVKKLIEEKKYPIVLLTEQGIDDLLNWLASNELYSVWYTPLKGGQNKKAEPYERYDHDLEEFVHNMPDMSTYSWVSENIAELLYYTSSGAHYEYMCTEDKIETAYKIAESRIEYPIALYAWEEFEEAIDDMGGQEAFTIKSATKDSSGVKFANITFGFRPVWNEEGWSYYTSVRVSPHVIELVNNSSKAYYYMMVGDEGLSEAEAIADANLPISISTYAEYVEATNKLGMGGKILLGYCGTTWGTKVPSTEVFTETGKGGYNSYSSVSWISDGVIELVKGGEYSYLFNVNDSDAIEFARIEAEKHPRVLM